MEKIMTNGFCELNEQEMLTSDGGFYRIFNEIKCQKVYERAREGVLQSLRDTGRPVSTLSDYHVNLWKLDGIEDPDINI